MTVVNSFIPGAVTPAESNTDFLGATGTSESSNAAEYDAVAKRVSNQTNDDRNQDQSNKSLVDNETQTRCPTSETSVRENTKPVEEKPEVEDPKASNEPSTSQVMGILWPTFSEPQTPVAPNSDAVEALDVEITPGEATQVAELDIDVAADALTEADFANALEQADLTNETAEQTSQQPAVEAEIAAQTSESEVPVATQATASKTAETTEVNQTAAESVDLSGETNETVPQNTPTAQVAEPARPGNQATTTNNQAEAVALTQQNQDQTAAATGETQGATESQTTAGNPEPWQQMAEVIRPLRTMGDGSQRLSLHLRPAELGSVHLEIAMRNGQLSVRAVADNMASRDMLAAALPELRAELSKSGLDIGSIDVGEETSSNAFTSGQDADNNTKSNATQSDVAASSRVANETNLRDVDDGLANTTTQPRMASGSIEMNL